MESSSKDREPNSQTNRKRVTTIDPQLGRKSFLNLAAQAFETAAFKTFSLTSSRKTVVVQKSSNESVQIMGKVSQCFLAISPVHSVDVNSDPSNKNALRLVSAPTSPTPLDEEIESLPT